MSANNGRVAQLRRHLSLLEADLQALRRAAGVRGLNWAEVERAMGLSELAAEMAAEMERLQRPRRPRASVPAPVRLVGTVTGARP
jgi:hypothetical protein